MMNRFQTLSHLGFDFKLRPYSRVICAQLALGVAFLWPTPHETLMLAGTAVFAYGRETGRGGGFIITINLFWSFSAYTIGLYLS